MAQDARLTAAFQAVATDIKALQDATRRALPFFDSTGARNGVLLNPDGSLPFLDASGAANNITTVTP